MKLDDIKAALLTLNTTELAEVIKAARLAKQHADTPNEQFQSMVVAKSGADPYDYILEWICAFCQENGTDARFVSQAKASPAYTTFRRCAPNVVAFLRKFCHCQHRLQENAFIMLALKQMLLKHGSLVNTTYCMGSFHNVPATINALFPGYVTGGLMPSLVARLGGKGKLHVLPQGEYKR